jgi:hypothetical protein
MIAPAKDPEPYSLMREAGQRARRLVFEMAKLLIRVELRSPQHVQAEPVPGRTPWPTGLAPLCPFVEPKFNRLRPVLAPLHFNGSHQIRRT